MSTPSKRKLVDCPCCKSWTQAFLDCPLCGCELRRRAYGVGKVEAEIAAAYLLLADNKRFVPASIIRKMLCDITK